MRTDLMTIFFPAPHHIMMGWSLLYLRKKTVKHAHTTKSASNSQSHKSGTQTENKETQNSSTWMHFHGVGGK